MDSDFVIIGAGIAGLSVAEGLLKKGSSVTLLERYPNVGGRIVTNRDPYQYEIGAGRIFHTHKRVKTLIRRFKLHTYPISDSSDWISSKSKTAIPSMFDEWIQPVLFYLQSLSPEMLASSTIAELLPKEWHPQLKQFPYWAELFLLRADLALKSFQEEMGTNDGYVGIVEGIDSLTTKLAASVERNGGKILRRYRVEDIRVIRGGYEIVGDFGKKAEAAPFSLRAKEVVIATCRCSLSTFSVLSGHPLLKQLQTSPLTRIYAAYPKGKNGKVWFDGIPKMVTDSPLRFVIPIDPKKGLIMISYTDGPDTERWKPFEGAALQREIQKEVRKLFGSDIPEPVFLQKHEWASGCTYWVPTDRPYDLVKAREKAMFVRKGLYVVGESVSFKQAWIEGALESAEYLLKHL